MARAQETVTDMPQIGDRLAAARRSRFVGRQAELEQFGAALLAAEPPFAVLYLHGPGGVGKSTLLHAFARLAAASSRPVLFLDGHHLAPTPPDFLRVLGHQLGQAGGALTDIVRAWPSQGVLLLDTYEQLAPLDGWLRDTLLPQLPTDTLIVLASRTPPASAWRTDLAWADLLHPVLLDNLPPFESRAYLQARGIPLSLHADVLAFTHGHPLALALVADVLRQGSMPATFRPEAAPDVMRALLERFLHDAPSQEHRQALDICVLAWATTESLLAAVLDTPDTAALFAWLRGLSFIAQGPYGLFPHDLMREALLADLRWRDPVGHRHLVGRLVAYLAQELTQARGVVQQRLCFDLLALTRHHPAYQTYFDWKAFGSGYAAPAVPDDHTALVALIAQHEGAASAQIAQYWLGCQPHAWLAFHSLDGALLGGMAHLALEQLQPDDAAADPAVAAAWAFGSAVASKLQASPCWPIQPSAP
jgi:energy-coupling factor transporter ATP-binding protein EcfA2